MGHSAIVYSNNFVDILTNVLKCIRLFGPLLLLGHAADWGAIEGQATRPRETQLGLCF
jgi:hypothetical protein